MQRSRQLTQKLLHSPSWSVLRNHLTCTSSFTVQQIRHKKTSSEFTTPGDPKKEVPSSPINVSHLLAPVAPVPVPVKVANTEDGIVGVELAGKLNKQDILQVLNKFFRRNEVKMLSAEHGLDNYLFHQAFMSFRKFCLEDSIPRDLHTTFSKIMTGAAQVDDLFNPFLKHAQIMFPELDGHETDAEFLSDFQNITTTIRTKTFTSTERNFITPLRAMEEYLLQPHDLGGLRRTFRRSPHVDEPPILVYWRRDVESRAMDLWGGKEEVQKLKRERYNGPESLDALIDVRQILKKYRKEHKDKTVKKKEPSGLKEGSGRIVMTAVMINGTNFVLKLLGWYMTGSHSLFAEAIHSLADTTNQLILAYGIHKSTQSANIEHPYGYTNMRHVASLISGVGIFCVGAGMSFYHGITGLYELHAIESLYWAMIILAGSLVSEGATLFLACNSIRKRAKEVNISFRDFILRGRDPSLNVVILEDTAAVAGVGIAAACMALTMYTGSPIPDALGSLAIGGLLGGVASFIIYSNSAALVGRSIPRDNLEQINTELESDVMIRAIHDVKGIDMGNNKVRYKAEVDFDGRELTRTYLDKQELDLMLQEVKEIATKEDVENFVLKHGENIVDTLGAEIDRIERRLRESHPEIRHCDLEIL